MRNTIIQSELLPKYSFYSYSATARYAHPCRSMCKAAFNINPMCKNPRFLYISSTTCAKNGVFGTLDAFYALGSTSPLPRSPKTRQRALLPSTLPRRGVFGGEWSSFSLPNSSLPAKNNSRDRPGGIVVGGFFFLDSKSQVWSLFWGLGWICSRVRDSMRDSQMLNAND